MANSIEHWLLYVDSTAWTYVVDVSKLLPPQVTAKLNCLDPGNFGYSEAFYASEFQNKTEALHFNMLYYDSTSGTQLYFACVDQNSFKELLH